MFSVLYNTWEEYKPSVIKTLYIQYYIGLTIYLWKHISVRKYTL